MKMLRLPVLLSVILLCAIALSLRFFPTHAATSTNSKENISESGQPPTAVADSYTLHPVGSGFILPVLANDSDPEGDRITLTSIETAPQHGTAQRANETVQYQPTSGYVGSDSFTYKVCEFFESNLCSIGTVSITLVNQAPVGVDDLFVIRGGTQINFVENDSDPDQDDFHIEGYITYPQHGILSQTGNPRIFHYLPQPLYYTGTDSFIYRICDSGAICATATVTFEVIADGEGENDGLCGSCNDGVARAPGAVGQPVNVTNGNMYLQQLDYILPGAGPELDITRTYNSNSQRPGLFGNGWFTEYDQSVTAYDSNLARFYQADGRSVYFGRPVGSNAALTPLEKDVHASLVQNGSNGFTLTLKDGSVREFDAAGKLTSLSDRVGNQTAVTYTSGKIASITDPFGRVLSFSTNSNAQVLTIADTMGTIATYTYNGSSQLTSVTYADNSAFNFSYGGGPRLTSVTDALGNIIESHTYDGAGRAITSEKDGGVEHYSLSYVSATRTDVTDALGHVTKYTFDTSKGRNVVTNVEGLCSCGGSQIQSWIYDNDLNVTSRTDALNHVTSYTYDSDGNRLTETDATGTVTFTYNQFGQVLTRTDQMNGVTTNTYDSGGNLLTTEDALSHTTTFIYDPRGQLMTVTDARGAMTSFAWDTSGRLAEVADALHHTTNYAYDARARITSVTNALNETTSREYDDAGRLKKIIHPDTSFVLYTYDLAGRNTKVKDARGNETNLSYDDAYRLTSVTDALSHVTAYGYDLMSNRTSVTDALSRVTNYDYDDFNRLKKITYPPVTTGAERLFETVTYDAAGNVTERADTAGRVTSYGYDNANRLTSTTDAENKTTSFQHDALSRTTAVIDALEQEYDFFYDALGRQTGMTRASVSTSYVYDEVGNRTERTDYNGATTNYTYDNANRLTTVSYPDLSSATYDYDALSRLTSATNQNGSVTFTYDDRGRIATTTDVWGQTLAYSYDANGNRTSLALNSSAYAGYEYDEENRLTQLNDSNSLSVTYDYDATNRLTQREFPNGTVFTYNFNGMNQLTHLRHAKGPHPIFDNQYSYNTANQIGQITDPGGDHGYNYDEVDRLTLATYGGSTEESYSYDAVGNRTSLNALAEETYGPFNRLEGFGHKAYEHDDNGNLTTGPYPTLAPSPQAWSEYAYDFENRLTQVSLAWRGALFVVHRRYINYKYDALGRRIERSTSEGAVERFVYESQDIIADLDANNDVVRTYLNGSGIDDKIRQTDENGDVYFTTDHLGSTTVLTDANGDEVENVTYDSFGNSSGSERTRYTYTGREFDSDTGLYFYRARWYDPHVGRFISEDPIGMEGGINFYAYVEDNPVNATDPEGLVPRDRWYGYNNRDFHRWFHNCWEEGGEGRQNATKEEIEIAHAEWISRGSPKGGRCWGGGNRQPAPVSCPEPAKRRSPRRWSGPSYEEVRLAQESARQSEMFWTKVLIGDVAVGAVLLAPQGAGVVLLRWVGSAGRWVPVH